MISFRKILYYSILLFVSNSFAQVGIGTSTPEETSILDINPSSSDKGLLIPRINIPNLNNQSPIVGDISNSESLLVYNTNATSGKGFYYWSGSQWLKLSISGDDTSVYKNDGIVTEDYRTINLNDNIFGYINNFADDESLYLAPAGLYGDEFFWSSSSGLGFAHEFDKNFILDENRMATLISNNAPPTATTGSLVIQHEVADGSGVSSILFPSATNTGSDYGYLSYEDDGSTNGSTNENGLLTLGIANDAAGTFESDIDNINIQSSGSVGISNRGPSSQSSLDIGGNNKGLLINRVALTSTNTKGPIVGNFGTMPESLLVYNTATAGTAPNNVVPGFYYWSGSQWLKLSIAGEDTSVYTQNGTVTEDFRTINLDDHIFGYKNNAVDDESLYLSPAGVDEDEFYWSSTTGLGFALGTDKNFLLDSNRMATLFSRNAPPTATTGSLVIQHELADETGVSSIVFPSASNFGSDYGYISYEDNNSAVVTSDETSVLTIGIQNDGGGSADAFADNINLASSGSIGISNRNPSQQSALDLGQSNRGLLINRVALTSTDTKGSIVGAQATLPESLLVYNTATAGTSPTNVVPGFYYWTGSRWTKLQSTESTNNIYNTNGTLQGDRIINTADHSLSLTNSAGRPLTIIPAEASDDDAPFRFQTNNSIRFDIDSDPVLDIEHNGRVGIGTDVPQTKLHVNVSGSFYDGMRIQSASFEGGVMTQENGNYLNFENSSPEGGHSFNFARQRRLIVNDTRILPGINAQNDNVNSLGSGVMDMGSPSQHFRRLYARGIHVNDNSATGGLNLSIGDNGDTTPTYKVTSTAIYPNSNSTKNLGTANNHWNDLFMTGEIRSAAGDPINVTLNAIPDYIFAEEAFHPANDQQKDLGRSALRWRTLYYTNASVTSDRRLKKNILPLEKSLDVIKKLEGFQYNFKKDDERLHFGFMAQDLQKILPNLVFVGDDKDKTLGLNYTELIPILVNAIKEQQQIIENQSSKLDDLQTSINEIKSILTKNALKGSYAEN